MKYFELVCKTCNATCQSVVATLPGELLSPDYEACEEQVKNSSEHLLEFHKKHGGHQLEEVEIVAQ